MGTITASIIATLILTILLVAILLVAKAKLLPSGNVHIKINGEKDVEVPAGGSLLSTLGKFKNLFTLSLRRRRNLFAM